MPAINVRIARGGVKTDSAAEEAAENKSAVMTAEAQRGRGFLGLNDPPTPPGESIIGPTPKKVGSGTSARKGK